MFKKYYMFIVFLFSVIIGIALNLFVMPNRITSNIYKTVYLDLQEEIRNKIYNLNFTLNDNTSYNVNTYFINRKETTQKELNYYSEMFGVTENFTDEKYKYVYTNENTIVEIMKNINMLKYTNKILKNNDTKKITSKDSINIIIEFLSINKIQLNYDEITVKHKNNKYEINFIKKVGNLKDYSFVNNAIIDEYGNILSIEYYFIEYKKLKSLKVKSAKEAFQELPLDLYENTFINLNECNLVYFYEDSIVQPAYLFKGIASDGKPYEYFIKAIK